MIKLNGTEIKFEKFPNGETMLKKSKLPNIKGMNKIDFKYEEDSDLIELMILKNEICNDCILNIAYMPYSRMDRGSDNISFTLKSICKFIKSLDFVRIYINEPHSDVCVDMMDAHALYYTPELLKDNIKEINPDYILFPDKGAYDRYQDMFKQFNIPIIKADKKRNFETGTIESLKIVDDVEQDSTIVIVDDLSSYGGTFLWASSKLKEKGVNDIYLVIGHAEKNILKGDIPSSKLIKRVFTTNSIISKNDETDKIKIKEMVEYENEPNVNDGFL